MCNEEEENEWLDRCIKYNDPKSEHDLEEISPW
jgi:hypothetical protein